MRPDKEVRSSKYLNNLMEQVHRSMKQRIAMMLGLKRFRNAAIMTAGIELMHRIRKGQFALGRLGLQGRAAPAVREAVLGSLPHHAAAASCTHISTICTRA